MEYKNKGRYIPNMLRLYRKMHGYTQEDVAFHLGLKNRSLVAQWENGLLMPGSNDLLQLCFLLNRQPCDLYPEWTAELKGRILEKKKVFKKKKK